MVTSLKNTVLIILAGLVLIPATAQAESMVTCKTPLSLTSTAYQKPKVKKNNTYIKRVDQIIAQQHASDSWAQAFLSTRGFNYNNVNIVTMYRGIKKKYPAFFKSYIARERQVSHSLYLAINKFGAPTSVILGGDTSGSALWLTSRATDEKDLASFYKLFLQKCKAHAIPCGIVPIVKDREQFVSNGTQTYGTLPNVVIQPAVKSLADLNARRHKFQLPPAPKVCFKVVSTD